jgi:SpoVK/Ycf46/Vps4 family AAA+-type ATPase
LFFDEADAPFGKHTNVQSSHDKYANQEVSYLLQRVEDYPGLLILASNFKSNLDEAFISWFHEVVHFPVPDAGEKNTLGEIITS